MATEPMTLGQLTTLLADMGFEHKVFDEHRVGYRHKSSGSFFVLPNRPPETRARESDYLHVRSQLDWLGLMEKADFDTHFAQLTAVRLARS